MVSPGQPHPASTADAAGSDLRSAHGETEAGGTCSPQVTSQEGRGQAGCSPPTPHSPLWLVPGTWKKRGQDPGGGGAVRSLSFATVVPKPDPESWGKRTPRGHAQRPLPPRSLARTPEQTQKPG